MKVSERPLKIPDELKEVDRFIKEIKTEPVPVMPRGTYYSILHSFLYSEFKDKTDMIFSIDSLFFNLENYPECYKLIVETDSIQDNLDKIYNWKLDCLL